MRVLINKKSLIFYLMLFIITTIIPLSINLTPLNDFLVRLTLIIPLISLYSCYQKKTFFHLKFVISLIFFFFWSLRTVALAQRNFIFYEVPFNDTLKQGEITHGLLVGILFISTVYIFSYFSEKTDLHRHRLLNNINLSIKKSLFLFTVCVIGGALLLQNAEYWGNGVIIRHGDGASSIIKYLIYFSEPLLVYLFSVIVFSNQPKKSLLFVFIIILISSSFNIILGDRLSLVSAILVLLIFIIHKQGILKIKQLLLSGVTVFAFSFYTIAKRYAFPNPIELVNVYLKVNENSLINVSPLQLFTRDFTPTDLSFLTIKNTYDVGFIYGKSIFDAFVLIIPRALWPGKPTNLGASSINSDLYPHIFDYTHISPGIIGDLYLNFGIFFLPAILIWLFFVKRTFFTQNQSVFEKGLGICYIMLCFKLGFLDSTTRLMVVYLPSLILINRIRL